MVNQNRVKIIPFSIFVLMTLFTFWVIQSEAYGETVEKGIVILV
jgi:hypothetical protein